MNIFIGVRGRSLQGSSHDGSSMLCAAFAALNMFKKENPHCIRNTVFIFAFLRHVRCDDVLMSHHADQAQGMLRQHRLFVVTLSLLFGLGYSSLFIFHSHREKKHTSKHCIRPMHRKTACCLAFLVHADTLWMGRAWVALFYHIFIHMTLGS
jgi:hypothetical protein